MSGKEKYTFPGKEVDVIWDERLCIHIGECGQASGDLFVGGREPWCQPDLVENKSVIDVVKRCPSGALTYQSRKMADVESADAVNRINVTYNGPYFIRGNINIEAAPDDMQGIAYRVALCRCGASKNKPFCDNTHEQAKFSDFGAVGNKGEVLTEQGGPLNVKPLADGPLQVSGNIKLYNGSGQLAWMGVQLWLCRCGSSKNKPFCDGSHKNTGFKT